MADISPEHDRRDWSVIMVNVGSYDVVHGVPPDASTADWVYVTDHEATAKRAERLGWRSVRLPPADEPAFLRSRYPKAQPEGFTDRPSSIYLDARYVVETEAVVDELSSHLAADSWIAMFRHDDRHSIFEEAAECRRLGIGGPLVETQMAHYLAMGIQPDTGLWCGAVIVRRHCPAQADFGRAWMEELRRWPTRDQLSLPVVLDQRGVTPSEIPGSMYSWPGLRVTSHRVRRPGEPRLRAYRRRLKEWLSAR